MPPPYRQVSLSLVTIGADPELFILTAKGTVIRAKKHIVRKGIGSGTITYDNIAIEFQPYPSTCSQYVIDYLGTLIKNVHASFLDKNDYSLSFAPALLITARNRVKEVNDFGCAPSLTVTDIGDIIETVPSINPIDCEYRSIGGHLHFSDSKENAGWNVANLYRELDGKDVAQYDSQVILKSNSERIKLTRLCDILLGTLGCLYEYRMGNQEAARIRRQMIGYGRAGEFRVNKKSYEYRTLSPWWLAHPILAHLVFNIFRDLTRLWECEEATNFFLSKFSEDDFISLSSAINSCDPVECERLLVQGVKAFNDVGKKYGFANATTSILGAPLRGKEMLLHIAYVTPDFYLWLSSRDSPLKRTVIQRDSGKNWDFMSHHWGWKNYAHTYFNAIKRARKINPIRRVLTGHFINDTWSNE